MRAAIIASLKLVLIRLGKTSLIQDKERNVRTLTRKSNHTDIVLTFPLVTDLHVFV